jgi:hypothetical protein
VQIDFGATSACVGCRLVVTRIVRLGSTSGDGYLPAHPRGVARDSRGRYFVVSGSGAAPLAFDSIGRFLGELGRRGQGPGEYVEARSVFVLPGDSILAFDRANRYTVHTPSLRYARGGRTGNPFTILPSAIALLRDGSVIAAERSLTASRVGFPLHRLSRDGLIARFGRDAKTRREGVPRVAILSVGPGMGANVWIASRWPFTATLLNGDGGIISELTFGAPWLPRESPPTRADRSRPPYPALHHLGEDTQGRLWVAFHVPGEHWETAWGKPLNREGTRFNEPRWDHLYSTVIGVVDLRSRRALASAPVDGYLLHFIDDHHFATATEDADGAALVDIWRMSLIGSPAPH